MSSTQDPAVSDGSLPALATNGETKPPRVFIGMPVFNGCPYIEDALQSLTSQTFREWRLLIADNCSTDSTAEVCKRFVDADSRISYVRHDRNQGAGFNFRYVLDASDSEFFMWAAADDVWEADFISAMVGLLDAHSAAGAAFCEIDTIDSFGQVIRTYPSFVSFSSPPATVRDAVSHYLWAAEYMGKPNLFYALYRRSALTPSTRALLYDNHWGLDMAMVLSVMTRHPYVIADQLLFHKRQVRQTDIPGIPHAITPAVSSYGLTREMIPGYFIALWKATRRSRFCLTAVRIMTARFVGTVLSLPIRGLTNALARLGSSASAGASGRGANRDKFWPA